MRVIVDEVHAFQKECLSRLGVRFAYLTDEFYLQLDEPVPPKAYYDGLSLEENGQGMVRNFLDDWKKVKREIKESANAARCSECSEAECTMPRLHW